MKIRLNKSKLILPLLALGILVTVGITYSPIKKAEALGNCELSNPSTFPTAITPGQGVTISWQQLNCIDTQIKAPDGTQIDMGALGDGGKSQVYMQGQVGTYTIYGWCQNELTNNVPSQCAEIYATVGAAAPQTATVTTNADARCPASATYTLSGNNQTFSSSQNPWTVTVNPQNGGSIYMLSYSGIDPSHYAVTVAPSSGINVFPGDTDNFYVSCPPITPVPIVTVSASSQSLSCPSSDVITWGSQYANSCTDWNGNTVGISGSQTVNVSKTTTYTVSCTGDGGTSSSSTQVTVNSAQCPTPPPTVNISATPSTITAGDSTNFAWSSANATSCTSQWQDGSYGSLSGSAPWTLWANTTMSMTCTGPGGSTSKSVNVTVNPVTTASLQVNTNNTQGNWSISPGNLTGTGTNKSYVVTPSSGGTTYTIVAGTIGSNYTSTVSNSDGGGSSLVLVPGDSKSFNITYTLNNGTNNYTLSNSGNSNVTKGGIDVYTQNVITATKVQGNPPPQSFTASGAPSGVDTAFSNQNCSPSCTSTLTFTVHPSAPTGTFPITVQSLPGNVNTTFNLIISPAPTVSVTNCSAGVTSAAVGQNVTWSANVSGGAGAPYTYSWSGTNIPTNPAPSSASFTTSYSTIGTKTAQLTATDKNGNRGSCTPAGQLQINFSPSFQEF